MMVKNVKMGLAVWTQYPRARDTDWRTESQTSHDDKDRAVQSVARVKRLQGPCTAGARLWPVVTLKDFARLSPVSASVPNWTPYLPCQVRRKVN